MHLYLFIGINMPRRSFWYSVAAPDMGPRPFDLNAKVELIAQHAPAPRTREEGKQFIRVLELNDEGTYSWRGEWLSLFPRYTDLDDKDLEAWQAWIDRPEQHKFFDDTIAECQRLAEISKTAQGYAVIDLINEPNKDVGMQGTLRIPTKGH